MAAAVTFAFTLPFLPTEQMQPEKLGRFPPVSQVLSQRREGRGRGVAWK